MHHGAAEYNKLIGVFEMEWSGIRSGGWILVWSEIGGGVLKSVQCSTELSS